LSDFDYFKHLIGHWVQALNRYVCDWLKNTLQKHVRNLWCSSQSTYTNTNGSILNQMAISGIRTAGTLSYQIIK